MKIDVIVPEVGESITNGILAKWFKADGDMVEEGEDLFEFETDKTTLVVPSNGTGVLKILVQAETEINIGQVIGQLESDAGKQEAAQAMQPETSQPKTATASPDEKPLSPAVKRIVAEHGLDIGSLPATGPKGNITKEDALRAVEQKAASPKTPPQAPQPATLMPQKAIEGETRVKMTLIRKRIAENLVQSQKNAAHLTTFHEIDMSKIMALRSDYKETFEQEFGVRLGYMSFFIKAAQSALARYPEFNAYIEGDEIVYHQYYHIGVAMSTERGLITPVVKHVEQKNFATIEKELIAFRQKVDEKKLLPQELMGGTFTITNGGVFGSLLSTPIPSPPQSGILGMQTIQKRPVVVQDEIVIRPMMYVSVTYDHRIIDGKEAIQFLLHIKNLIEDPNKLLLAL